MQNVKRCAQSLACKILVSTDSTVARISVIEIDLKKSGPNMIFLKTHSSGDFPLTNTLKYTYASATVKTYTVSNHFYIRDHYTSHSIQISQKKLFVLLIRRIFPTYLIPIVTPFSIYLFLSSICVRSPCASNMFFLLLLLLIQ